MSLIAIGLKKFQHDSSEARYLFWKNTGVNFKQLDVIILISCFSSVQDWFLRDWYMLGVISCVQVIYQAAFLFYLWLL